MFIHYFSVRNSSRPNTCILSLKLHFLLAQSLLGEWVIITYILLENNEANSQYIKIEYVRCNCCAILD